MASALVITCDAPGCEEVLTDAADHPVFTTMLQVYAAIEARDWATWSDRRDVEHFYCRRHWRWSYGERLPYWGRRTRIRPIEQGF